MSHDLALPHDHAGFLWAHEPMGSPWLRPVRLWGELAGRVADVRRFVTEHELRVVGVRARGGEDPTEWEKKLRSRGGRKSGKDEGPQRRVTIHLTRDGKRVRAWVTEEVAANPESAPPPKGS